MTEDEERDEIIRFLKKELEEAEPKLKLLKPEYESLQRRMVASRNLLNLLESEKKREQEKQQL